MTVYYLSIALASEATFGRGDGVPGLVDREIDHDEAGCPLLGGRALKGLLLEEAVNLRFALGEERWQPWTAASTWLFGVSGATTTGTAQVHIGPALLPPALRAALHAQVRAGEMRREDVLDALTSLRRQTAVNAATGAPEQGSLRTMRVLLRDTPLIARLDCATPPDADALALLAACVLAVRRGGTGRNRGRGRLQMLLHADLPAAYTDATFTKTQVAHFAHKLGVALEGYS
ncbi:hypothetical protein [Candidatus Chloroploca sp. Khr17]|uniref:hypothetical protein n=1 Tax=Candidatus Chloroploca sp. Khr17 TaxID=2496869 RepID=UPI00196AE4E3|nr:hypothetical protein [Candidatus Chloroploca sp. Khr17]